MPRCRTPIPSKGKQRIWAIFYMKRSIETQIAVVITCTADKRWMTCARGIPAVYLAVPSIQAKIQMMSHHQLHPFAFTLSLLCLCNAQSVRTTSFRDPSSLNWGQDRCWKCRVASRPHGHTVRTATGYLVPILVHSFSSLVFAHAVNRIPRSPYSTDGGSWEGSVSTHERSRGGCGPCLFIHIAGCRSLASSTYSKK